MKTLVTGATGFIGYALVARLIRGGDDVRCLVRDVNTRSLPAADVERVAGDVRDPEAMRRAVQGVQRIYHLAGAKNPWHVGDYADINHTGTVNLFEAAAQAGSTIDRFVFVSSQAAAGPSSNRAPMRESDACHPLTAYGRSKRDAERFLIANRAAMPIRIARPTLVYGPRSEEVRLIFRLLRMRCFPPARGPQQQFNAIDIDDCVEGILAVAEAETASGETYFLTDGISHTWSEVAAATYAALGRAPWLLPLPWRMAPLGAATARAACRLVRLPYELIDDKLAQLREPAWLCDPSKACDELGFRTRTTLTAGVARCVSGLGKRR